MRSQIQRLLSPPIFPDEDQTRLAALLNLLLHVLISIMVLDTALVLVVVPDTPFTLWVNGLTLLMMCGSLWIMRLGHVRLAGIILCLTLWPLTLYYIAVSGGLASSALGFLSLFIVVGVTLFGAQGAMALGVLDLAGIGLLYLAGSRGLLTWVEGTPTLSRLFVTNSVLFLLLTSLIAISGRSVSKALVRARNAERALAERNRDLQREIADHKQTETALAKERNLLRSIIDILPDNVFVKDSEGRFLLNNVVSMKLLGASRQEELLGKTDFDFFPHDIAAYYAAKIEQLVRTGQPIVDHEEFQPWQSEHWRWQISSVIPLRDEGGEVIGLVGRTTDITPRKQVEQALRNSEERYRVVSELISDFAYCIHVASDGTLDAEWVTDSFARMTRFRLDELLQGEGHQLSALVHSEDQAQLNAETVKLLRGETVDDEYRIITRSGEMRWLHLYRQPVWDAARQRVARYYGIAQDITERKQAEQALRRIDAKARAILDAMPDWMVRLNRAGEILDFKAIENDLYLPGDTIIGSKIGDTIPGDFRAKTLTYIAKTLDTGQLQTFEFQLPRSRGTQDYEARMVMGGVDEVLAIVRNVTERKRDEDALRASEEQYRALFEQTNDAIFLINLNGDYLSVNQRAAEMFGYTVDELRSMSVRDLVPPVALGDSLEKLNALNARRPVPVYERTFRKKDGSELIAEVSASMVPDTLGHPHYIQSVVRDITERKQAEKQRLELLLAQEKTASLRQFIAGLSHDLKTPLSVIDLSIHLLERLSDAERQKHTIEVIKQQTLHLEQLIQDILTLSNLNNVSELALKPTDVNRVIHYIATRFHDLAQQKRLTMNLDLTTQPLLVLADEEELNRAIVKLVENALDYTSGGGVITLRTFIQDHSVVSEVCDTGAGINPTDLPELFNRFYRADQVHTPQQAGLGLTIVKKIVDLHHGKIIVESRLEAGSSFKIILPQAF